jgi:hypothetical protein
VEGFPLFVSAEARAEGERRWLACPASFGYSRTLSYPTIGARKMTGGEMKNPLDSLWGTVISGVIILVILYNIVRFALQ